MFFPIQPSNKELKPDYNNTNEKRKKKKKKKQRLNTQTQITRTQTQQPITQSQITTTQTKKEKRKMKNKDQTQTQTQTQITTTQNPHPLKRTHTHSLSLTCLYKNPHPHFLPFLKHRFWLFNLFQTNPNLQNFYKPKWIPETDLAPSTRIELQGDPIQKKEEEERVGWIVNDSSGEQTAHGGDECQRAAVGFFRRKNCCQRRAKWRLELVKKRKAILSLGFLLFGFAWVCKFGLRHVKTWVCWRYFESLKVFLFVMGMWKNDRVIVECFCVL